MENTRAYAQTQDAQDTLAPYRDAFFLPQHQGRDTIYFCGNSLGLQPKQTAQYLEKELTHWQRYGVEGHFRGEMPWANYHHFFKETLSQILGAKTEEIVVMGSLTNNLHLMMVSFYQPKDKRYKILMEAGAFPSDQYAVESQLRFHGYAYDDAVIEIAPREGEHTLRTEDIEAQIQAHGDEIALVLFSGVQYYTGQFFDLPRITQAAHAAGALVGFDLAHAAGNLPLHLHETGPDFAVWCSYKYLNSSPGGVSGIFVHERHAQSPDLPRFAGWWGHDENRRFLMERGFQPMYGADGWQLSNAPVLMMAAHKASLDIFAEVGIDALRAKSKRLTAYLDFLLEKLQTKTQAFTIITPKAADARGCQLSMLTDHRGKALFEFLSAEGVICDWREPNVIRLAPVPLYNSFEDVWRFVDLMERFFMQK